MRGNLVSERAQRQYGVHKGEKWPGIGSQMRDFLLEHLVDGNSARVYFGEVAGNLQLLLCVGGRTDGQSEASCQVGEYVGEVHGASSFKSMG